MSDKEQGSTEQEAELGHVERGGNQGGLFDTGAVQRAEQGRQAVFVLFYYFLPILFLCYFIIFSRSYFVAKYIFPLRRSYQKFCCANIRT